MTLDTSEQCLVGSCWRKILLIRKGLIISFVNIGWPKDLHLIPRELCFKAYLKTKNILAQVFTLRLSKPDSKKETTEQNKCVSRALRCRPGFPGLRSKLTTQSDTSYFIYVFFFWGIRSSLQISCLFHSNRRHRHYPWKSYTCWWKFPGAFSSITFCFLIFFPMYIFFYCCPVSSHLTCRKRELPSWHQFCAPGTSEFSQCHPNVINTIHQLEYSNYLCSLKNSSHFFLIIYFSLFHWSRVV